MSVILNKNKPDDVQTIYMVANGTSCIFFEDADDAHGFVGGAGMAVGLSVTPTFLVSSSKKYKLLNDQPSNDEIKEVVEDLEFLRTCKFEAECCNASFPINSLRSTIKEAVVLIAKYQKLIEKAESGK